MPRVHRMLLVPKVTQALPHDPDGKLVAMHVKAMSIVWGAQFLQPADPSNAQYVGAVERAMVLMEDARKSWLECGDMHRAGNASAVRAGFALELDRFGDALRWLARARKELGPAGEKDIANNFSFVMEHVEDEYETALQQVALQAWRGVRVPKQA